MRFQAPESLAEQIAQHLGRLIMVGKLKPLERIQELKVASDLDVSRGSVREALLILERRHLIEIYPRKGAVVSDLSSHQVSCLYEMYATLLVMLAAKVSLNWEDADLRPINEQIQNINKVILAKDTSIEAVVDHSFELMDLCLGFCDNPYLQEALENLRPSISRTYYLAMRSRRDELLQSLNFYNGLLQAIQARDLAGLKLVIESFADHQKSLVLSVLNDRSAA